MPADPEELDRVFRKALEAMPPARRAAFEAERERAAVRRARRGLGKRGIAYAARMTRVELAPTGRGQRVDLGKLPKSTQAKRAGKAGISVRSQRQLDHLARERPDLLQRVGGAEISLDQAVSEAGWARRPSDLHRVRRLWDRLSDADRAAFLRGIIDA